ncbi:putative acyl-CoA carboxylase [Gordonia polyisoprenivorans NBRC 16320 = JCM 10675]|uniref:acetyl-CoA carboxylase n=1 Tax=Gordonia polyisoprenivorans TaxID=84595 RepID=A0A846WQU0_9ACTN|nr:carboxyl transferase domain-containing protein [Gordonia polyisoprenivorans]NKY03952.1 carbamoyl-phosphate-synthetase [Gordonia polyisoprenivorans]GAB24264.1 putative acyl-CoA carboxylase [Gordonia polyisoprenivorans NBRC 16320 = JCM 10675]
MSQAPTTLFVANRGEIALRILRTASELGLRTVAVYSVDDADAPHVRAATTAVALPGTGPAAYLDAAELVSAASSAGATMVHPGYGFLSEDADFADACRTAGLRFVGPDSHVLRTFGDKAAARDAAVSASIPVLDATASGIDEHQADEFLRAHSAGIMLKAVAGGGGRGMRPVTIPADLPAAFRACTAEAQMGFGTAALFAEELLTGARHIEVQVVAAPAADGTVRALALGDRDCSVQRRRQKLVEIAPAPDLEDAIRRGIHRAAVVLCAAHDFRGLATVEFLVTAARFVFLEVNPRIQVEHTVTEEVTDVDLVATALHIAAGATYEELDLPAGILATADGVNGTAARPRGLAIQARVNAERIGADGATTPDSGTLQVFSAPTGPGIRVDTHGRPGLTLSPRFDSLLAKVIAHTRSDDVAVTARKLDTALRDFAIGGVETTIDLLRAVLAAKEFGTAALTTDFVEQNLAELSSAADRFAGERAEVTSAGDITARADISIGTDERVITAPMAGVVVSTPAADTTAAGGETLVILEAMKMEHVVADPHPVEIRRSLVDEGQSISAGTPLLVVADADHDDAEANATVVDPDHIRPDLAEVIARHAVTLDEGRPDAVAKRHRRSRRTARENIADLIDPDTFTEYGALALAAQRTRRSEADLIANTPADGLVGGVATIGADRFGASAAEAVVISYDYTVLAGTQGMRNHVKTDRLLEVARRKRIPLVLFAEGGGGRPGDTDALGAAGLELDTFRSMAGLRGVVPTVAVVSGRCFAGNAALAGACDVLIATPDANIGMGGPAMIEGGGLGVFAPEEIGPVDVQTRNGVIDVLARDEADAVATARHYLSYFQGDDDRWEAPDPRSARHVVPENRLRAYDIHAAIESIADVGSVLELRPVYGRGIVTALIRVEGVAYGLLANSSRHLGGAIDAEAADKAAEFLTLCQAHGLPLVTLCDTPGFMVGPESEEQATVRRFGNFFAAGARLTVPFGTVILRKGYGLGAMAMAGGSFHAPEFTIAWPTGEIGGMGLEGAVRLGFRKELDAVADPAERDALFADLLAKAYEHGKALHSATTFELDDVIDPSTTRDWIRQLGRSR